MVFIADFRLPQRGWYYLINLESPPTAVGGWFQILSTGAVLVPSGAQAREDHKAALVERI
jgi:hypothetical protein